MTDPTPEPRRPPRLLLAAAAVAGVVAVVAGVLATGSGGDAGQTVTVGGGAETSVPAIDPSAIDAAGPLAYELTLLDGSGTVRLGDLTGRPMVVNFFSSWCTPCVAEMPDIEAVHAELGDQVTFVGVNHQDSRPEGQAVARSTGVTYLLAEDPPGRLFGLFEGVGMPTTVFLDADGAIVAIRTGKLDADELRDRLAALLA